jgi:pimeloyl-ACP methyl ester carboxylesterase
MRKPFNVDEFAAADGKIDGNADLWHLFNVINGLPEAQQPAITLIGHSMGAIVVNEILQNFPQLPYRSIVFMGAAASVRETLAALDRVARARERDDLRFYNLSLHQDAEANEVGYFGMVSKGSLLEWVDRMYTTPATFADRTVGKWINVVMARGDFARLQSQANLPAGFKRFGLSCSDPLMHTEFDEYDARPACPPRIPYWRPSFWVVSEGAS